jgi:succinate dehydrogenase / fumarate reductase membrane anchor subunit
MSLKTPLSRASGSGTARSGADHWWAQRVSAVAMVPLALWFFWSIGGLNIADHDVVSAWFAEVTNATFALLLIANLCFHSYLGVQVVIEDYVSGPVKVFSLIVSQFSHIILVATGLIAIFRIVLGG